MVKHGFENAVWNVSRLYVPFESVATSVFLVKSDSGYILIDCATTEYDVDHYIIPAISDSGIKLEDIKYIMKNYVKE